MVMGNNNNKNDSFAEKINNDSDSFLSELIINETQSFVSDQLIKDDTVAADAKQIRKIHTIDNESFISNQYKDPDLEVQTIQKKKNESRRKKKNKSNTDILRTKTVIKGSAMKNWLIQKYKAY